MKRKNVLRFWAGLCVVLTLGLLSACGAARQELPLTTSRTVPTSEALTVTDAASTTATPETTAETTAETTTAPFSPDDTPMTATPRSSCFSEIGYSQAHETLVVRFRDSGQRYSYYQVPLSVWTAFRAADSLGRYFNRQIKGNYTCEKG